MARLLASIALLALFAAPAAALEFRSVAAPVAILYDAPSVKARKLWLLSRDYPVEVIVTLEKWVKVRDASGSLAWVERDKLSDKRMLLVTVPLAAIRQTPSATAPVVFQAEKDVVLELMEIGNGWVRVRHRDGASGWLELKDVWGL